VHEPQARGEDARVGDKRPGWAGESVGEMHLRKRAVAGLRRGRPRGLGRAVKEFSDWTWRRWAREIPVVSKIGGGASGTVQVQLIDRSLVLLEEPLQGVGRETHLALRDCHVGLT
jgi:hypothetical protein